MSAALEARIAEVKLEKAARMFENDVKVYGSEANALKALDCHTRHEAIQMLAVVQKYRIFKVDGVVRVA